MDWIRLGSSGVDLTGVGSKAGHLTVSILYNTKILLFIVYETNKKKPKTFYVTQTF